MNAEERKKHILDCAKRLFARNGYYNTQISDIVTEADIARGTVYQYFENKDDIFITLMENLYRDWQIKISTFLDDVDLAAINPRDYFHHRIRSTLEFFASDPDLCNIVLRMGLGLNEKFETLVKRFEKKIYALIIGDLELGIRNGHIPGDLNVDLMAVIITGGIFHTAYQFFSGKGKKKTGEEVDRLAGEIVDIFSRKIFKK